MTRLQDDILELYNTLTEFSDRTLQGLIHYPIHVYYDDEFKSVCFEQKGKKIVLSVLNYYCENLKNLKNSYLLPKDYDSLMFSLSEMIKSGSMLHDRICVSPMKYGFSLYETSGRSYESGPLEIGTAKFVSGNSWLFRFMVKLRYKNIL